MIATMVSFRYSRNRSDELYGRKIIPQIQKLNY